MALRRTLCFWLRPSMASTSIYGHALWPSGCHVPVARASASGGRLGRGRSRPAAALAVRLRRGRRREVRAGALPPGGGPGGPAAAWSTARGHGGCAFRPVEPVAVQPGVGRRKQAETRPGRMCDRGPARRPLDEHVFGSCADFCFFPLTVIHHGDASRWSQLAEHGGG